MSGRVHVVSVHWATDSWLDLQRRQLQQHLSDFPVVLHLGVGGGISEDAVVVGGWPSRESVEVIAVDGRHAENLDLIIGEIIRSNPARDDLLMILDQDAFPISSLGSAVEHVTSTGEPMAAVRSENSGDEQPHPLFFVCRLSMWSSLRATWREGPVRLGTSTGRRDVGGTLLAQLDQAGQPWVRLSRTADRGTHPVLYGVYGDLIYHHGAASRPVWTDADARRVYRSSAHRIVDGLAFRIGFLRAKSRRFREQRRLAGGHARETAAVFADPNRYVGGLRKLSASPTGSKSTGEIE